MPKKNKNKQQGGPNQPQQQGAGQSPTQEQQGGPNQPQQQGRRNQPQQQGRRNQPQQQGGPNQPQQQGGPNQPQQQDAWRSRTHEQQEGGRNQPQQQGGPNQPQQQGAVRSRTQEQQGGPNQTQQEGRRNQPQQQGGPNQPQQQGGPNQPQQQGAWRLRTHEQQEGGRNQPQQQGGHNQPQAQGASGARPKQGAGGDGPYQQQGGRGPSSQQQQGGRGPSSQQQQGGRQQSVASITSDFSKQSLSPSTIQRGTRGKKSIIETNYLTMNLDKMPSKAFHYDVSIEPDKPKKFMRGVFEQFCRLKLPKYALAYDGKKSCYTMERLPEKVIEDEVSFEDTGSRIILYKVAIKETDSLIVDLNSLRNYANDRVFDKPMRALQCLEVVMANPCHKLGVRAGRSFFTKPQNNYDLKDGYEMWTGLYQALILGSQPFFNVDISHKSFPSACPVIDYIKQNFDNINLNSLPNTYTIQNIKTYLKTLEIIYEPPASFGSFAKTYRVNNISDKAADFLSFKLSDGTTQTVANYYASKQYRLIYPQLPCLDVGSSVRSVYLPMELCKIKAGQAINKKDGPRQVQQMIRFAATSTNERKEKIMSMLNYFNHNVDPIINRFGILIGREFIKVPMRLLSSPYILYSTTNMSTKQTVRNGSWNMNNNFLETKKTITGGEFKWAIIYGSKCRLSFTQCENLADTLYRTAGTRNLALQKKPYIGTYDRIENELDRLKKEKFDLVIVVIPNFGPITYATIKQSAELKIGILTQCIKEQTVARRVDQTLASNVLLKINTKLNGTNHTLSENAINRSNVMYLGADVTHPSPDQRHIPSVVGVAASHDKFGACYNMQYRLQKSTLESIEDMESIFTHHLMVYKKYQDKYPENVIYYRDGVSDGQFKIVENMELRGIRAACDKLKIKMKLTCIIVVKRHHTRFFPINSQPDRFNKFNNVTPGTVVDEVIVHPNEVQFFMVSHQSIQGTAKPTRYNVIVDDANLNIDDLQQLTLNLCHMFPRCNRVVSYPAPAYLAHLVASRGRVYLEGTHRFDELRREYNKRLIREDFMNSNPSFFV